MAYKRSARKMSVHEFLHSGPPARPARTAARRKPGGGKGGGKKVRMRVGLITACLILLAALTVSNSGIWTAFTGYIRASSAAVVPQTVKNPPKSSIVLRNKPAFPGCAASDFRKLTVEQVSRKVCPSVVGIIQYQQGAMKETGEGSGIIMSSDGYILTNNHVVDGAYKLFVILQDGKREEAKLIGCDARTDIAIIKINRKNLQSAQFGNSDQCSVGEEVVAIGNPSGVVLAGSVTNGIISAINRNIDVGNGPMNLIQTDAAINPGNSGGALVNMYGQVVGVNSAKIVQQGFEGIGFSIPINTVKPIADSLMKYGYVAGRVKLGFNCMEIDESSAKMNGIPAGIYIEYVDPSSDAAKSGLKADDILTRINGKPVRTTDQLIRTRDGCKPDDTLELTVYRRSTSQQLILHVKVMEEHPASQTMTGGKAGKETYY